tara:strand:- start:747 stop:1319 length:573 start_codon:yes stop_codon:yes gene_type:complete
MYSHPKTRMLILPVVTLIFSAICVPPLWAANQSNYDLFKRVQDQVLRYSFFTVFDDVSAEIAQNGDVVLTGHVLGAHKIEDITKRVNSVEGVTSVTNNIRVLPASQFDDQLRYQIATVIYDNSHFWHYLNRNNPSIHIVVKRGHVTLTGVVDTEIDRTLAGSLATQFDAFSVTNELRLRTEVAADIEARG